MATTTTTRPAVATLLPVPTNGERDAPAPIHDVTENPSGGLLRWPDIRPPEIGFCILLLQEKRKIKEHLENTQQHWVLQVGWVGLVLCSCVLVPSLLRHANKMGCCYISYIFVADWPKKETKTTGFREHQVYYTQQIFSIVLNWYWLGSRKMWPPLDQFFFCKLLLNCASHDTKIGCIQFLWAEASKYKFSFLLCAGPLR